MASLLIRKLDDDLKSRLRQRAASRGRSMEAEARDILDGALPVSPINTGQKFIDAFRKAFGPLGGVDLELPAREPDRDQPKFDG